ncbi:MAG TPA: Ig-like domain-containing protein, partial [Catalimonadaceae bacterium]|nr:Ig-like domain-containing protein [Catalimonadaceae bacterium]
MNAPLRVFLLLSIFAFTSCSKESSTPPAVTVTSVKSGMQELLGSSNAENVSLIADLVVTFSKPIKSPSASDFILTPVGGSPVFLSISANGSSVTISPTTDLLRATQYTLTISSSLKADDGGLFLGQTVLFKTDNSNAPEVTLSSVKCAGKELTGLSVVEGVSVSADFLLTFSREVKTIPANSIQLKPTGGTAIPVSITQSGAVVTVNPNANILAGVEYTLSIDTTIKATDDGKFAGQFVVFKTVEPVTVTSIKSGSIEILGTTGLTGVSVSNDFLVTFSKSVQLPTIADFEFKSITGDNVPFSLIHAGSVVTLNPTTDLLNGTTYSITTKQTILATDGGPATSSTVNFKSEGFAVIPQTSHQIAYFGFNNNVNSSIGTWTSTNVSSSFTTDRFGLPNSSVSFNGTTDIIEVDNGAALFTPSSTLSFWVWADTTSGHGLFCMGINGFKG